MFYISTVEPQSFAASNVQVSRRQISSAIGCVSTACTQKTFACVAAFLLLLTAVSSAEDDVFRIVRVADGVFAAIAKPTFRLNCNAAIIVQDDGVIVVDAESVPSAAREVIKAIKNITSKPVKYLVITHFHGDHFQGSSAYLTEWPGVQVISSDGTREGIAKRGIPRMRRETLGLPARIERLNADLQKAQGEAERSRIRKDLQQGEEYYAELKTLNGVLPSLTVDRSLTLPSKLHKVEIMWLGRGHTDGDLYVYVPDARVMITGDALHSGTPTMTDASPYEWICTLATVERFDIDTVIGGHGDIIRGKSMFDVWRQYLSELMGGVAELAASGKTVSDARQALGPRLIAKYGKEFETIPAPFSQTVYANIDIAFRIVCGRLL